MSESRMQPRDRWIPWYFVGFFVFLAIMDGIFVYMATSTHTGVITKDSYNKGLAYNETVAAAEESAALGWKSSLDLQPGSGLRFVLNDDSGDAISGAVVRAQLVRPTQDGYDFTVDLHSVGAGEYEAPVAFPLDGQWDVRIFVEWKQQQYQHSQRLIVKP